MSQPEPQLPASPSTPEVDLSALVAPPAEMATDLDTILSAWDSATLRLQETHETLRGELARLTDELEVKNRELARKNRLADLGQIASHVAHEVRNSLVPMKLYLSLLHRRLSDDQGSLDVVGKIDASCTSMEAMTSDLLHFAADRLPQPTPVPVRDLIDEVCESLSPQLMAQGVATEIDVPAETQITADRDMLRRAVLNLALNALDAMPDGGELVITGCDTPKGFELEIADSGEGLSDEARGRAFEPFYTTKSSGTGLGLAIVFHILEVHGGEVTATNCPEGGAAFTLCIPRVALEEAKAA